MAKKALGKGLSAIISSSPAPAEQIEREIISERERIVHLDIDTVSPNPDQPRTIFNEEAINGLAESIKSSGLIQPIIVRKVSGSYHVVAGERRLRASKLAGIKKIKAIVIEVGEEEDRKSTRLNSSHT